MASIRSRIDSAGRAGKIVRLGYKKKDGTVVVRHVGPMSYSGNILYAQHQGQIKKFITNRIISANPTSTKFAPSGGFQPEIGKE